MKKIMFLTLGSLWILLSGCTKQEVQKSAQSSPPAKLIDGRWKASWSPDNRQLVYGKGGGLGLERMDIATRKQVPLLESGKDPAWSPSGRWIAFVREDFYNNYLTEQVWVTGVEGKDPKRLVLGGFPSWSSDGRKLFVHSRVENRLLEVDPESHTVSPISFFSNAPSLYFSVSPDKTRIAFGTAGGLDIRDRATGNAVASWPTPEERGLLPSWSPDGKLIAFGGFDGSELGLWVFEVATSKAAQIMEGNYTMPAWSPDSKWLAFDCRNGDREIWTVERPYIEAKLVNAKTAPSPEQLASQKRPRANPPETTSLGGKAAPDFNLPSLDGPPVVLSQLKGKVVVLDFWATWCPPCRKSLPHLQHVSQDVTLQKKGLKVVAINLREAKDKVQGFLTQNSYNFSVALDNDGSIAEKYLVQGIPTTVIIDGSGVIQNVFIGFGDESEKKLDAAIDALVGGG